MSKDKLLALAERVEIATGPDRELDAAIRDAVFQPCINPGAEYTASLDAAMLLAGSGDYTIGEPIADDHPFSVLTAAMTWCPLNSYDDLPRYVVAAALRAIAAKEPS